MSSRARALLVIAVALLAGWAVWSATRPRSPAGAPEVQSAPPRASAPPPAAPTLTPRRDRDAAASSSKTALSTATVETDASLRFGALRGTVISWSTGHGIAGADISFLHEGSMVVATSDGEGRFEIVADGPGTYTLAVATADGYLPYAPELGHSAVRFEPRPGKRVKDVAVYLFAAIDYTGRVVDAEGGAVEGAQVRLLGAHSGERTLVGLPDRFTSDAQGEFTFHAPDEAMLEATHPDHAPGRASVDGAVQATHHLRVVLGTKGTEVAFGSISGRVVDQRGVTIAGAEVRASRAGDPRRLAPRTLTGDDGSFEIERLAPGRHWVVATSEGYAEATAKDIEPGATGLELVLSAGASIEGQVRSREGSQPVPGATVIASIVDPNLFTRPVKRVSVFDAEGHYALVGLHPGAYTVTAAAHGFANAAVPNVVIEAPGATVRVDLELGTGGTITGTVVAAPSGAPLANARVTVESSDAGRDSALPLLTTTLTGKDGTFEIRGVSPGRQSVDAAAYGHRARTLSGIEVAEGEVEGPLRFELDPAVAGERAQYDIVGIGVEISARDAGLTITRVIEGGGAAEAGIGAGDVVVSVEGEPVASLGLDNAVQNIRGQEGTRVSLEVRRSTGKVDALEVKRSRIRG